MRADGTDEQRRQQHHVEDEQAADGELCRKLAAEDQVGDVGPHERDRHHRAITDAHAGARQQVVGQRIAGEPLGERQQDHYHADQPVQFTRPAKGAREKDAHHVGGDHRHEDERRPVMDLPEEQSGADVEADTQHRCEGGRHLLAAQRRIAAVVDDRPGIGGEEERQEDAGEHEDDEREQGKFTEQEGPVIREDLAQRRTRHLGQAGALVEPADQPLELGRPLLAARLARPRRSSVDAPEGGPNRPA